MLHGLPAALHGEHQAQRSGGGQHVVAVRRRCVGGNTVFSIFLVITAFVLVVVQYSQRITANTHLSEHLFELAHLFSLLYVIFFLIATLAEWSLHYGYLDAKPMYLAKGAAAGELHLKITIKHARHFWLCGANKESLQHATVYLDANVKDLDGAKKAAYTPGENRVLLTKISLIGNECREYSEIPVGTHVIGVSTDKSVPNHVTALTHLIMWH